MLMMGKMKLLAVYAVTGILISGASVFVGMNVLADENVAGGKPKEDKKSEISGKDTEKSSKIDTNTEEKTILTKEEVLKIAQAKAKKEGYDLKKYDMKGCHYQFTRKDHTWTVFFELKPPTPPGGHFMVWVDDQTKEAKLMPGE